MTMPEQVRFGDAFEVVVESERAFDEATLLPLEVEVVERRPSGAGEVVRLRARCYELGEVTLPLDPPRTLAVATSLPQPPGELEWPANGYQLVGAPPSRWLIAGLTALTIVFGYGWWRWFARRLAAKAEPTAAPVRSWSAVAALQALEVGDGDADAFFLRLKAIVRRHCAERFGMPADVRTSEELLVALPRLRERLSPCLQGCDLALFGPLPPAAEARERSRGHALAFVQASEEGA
ncbi:MAG: hypothetical protein ACE37K_01645 [Planctomycetota bacterium]